MEAIINLLLSPQDREARIQVRRASEDQWLQENPVLAVGEIGFDTTNNILKVGDGVLPWSGLSLQAKIVAESSTVTSTSATIAATPIAVKTAYDQAITATTNAASANANAETRIPKSLVTAKGDLVGATASGTPVRIPVGQNDAVLTADSSQPNGVKWASADEYLAYIFFN